MIHIEKLRPDSEEQTPGGQVYLGIQGNFLPRSGEHKPDWEY